MNFTESNTIEQMILDVVKGVGKNTQKQID